MTLWLKRAVLSAAIWSTVAAVYVFAALNGDGPEGLVKGTGPRKLIAACLGAGIIVQVVLAYLTRERRNGDRVLVDERDREVALQASQIAFAATAIGVFLGCIVLADVHQRSGCVPVGWVWFLGCGGWILSYLAQAVASIVLYVKAGPRGEG